MPAIILFGRGWQFSSDDFVFSSIFVIFLRTLGLLVAGLPVIIFYSKGPPIPPVILNSLYCAAVVNCTQIVLRCLLAYASSRGGIAEVEKRRSVGPLFYLNLFFVACEMAVYSIAVYLEAFASNCLNKACFYFRFACICGLALLVYNFIRFLMTFDSTGRVWRHHPDLWCLEDKGSSRRLNRIKAHRLIARLWHRRIRCLACMQNTCKHLDIDTKRNSRDAMMLVSDMVGTYFMTNLVASDLLAGLVLLRWQTRQWVGCGARVPLQRVLEDTEVYDPVMSPPPHTESVGVLVTPSVSDNAFNRLTVDWLSIRRLWMYSKFATAVYGHLLYLFAHRLSPRASLRLCKYLQLSGHCCCCCCCLRARKDHEALYPFLQQSDEITMGCCICKHDTCNLAVYQEITESPLDTLVYYSSVNTVYQSPFFVAYNEESESIVIAIRGTLSLEDVIVDMLAEGKHLQPDEVPPDVPPAHLPDFYVHMGMLLAARNLREIILRERLVEKARSARAENEAADGGGGGGGGGTSDYPLVVCGHSLGAGVASVLAFLLRKYYPEVKAYAYSPPLGLMSARMARYCKPFVVSVVLGYDIVPRLSIPTLNDLKWRLLSALQDCNIPKYRILANAMRIIGINRLLPAACRPKDNSIGLDSRYLSTTCRLHLMRPKVFEPRGAPSISSSTRVDYGALEEGDDTLDNDSIPDNAIAAQASHNTSSAAVSASSSRPVRFLSENRSLFRWLRTKTDVLLRTNASGTTYVPFVSAMRATATSSSTTDVAFSDSLVEVNEVPPTNHGDLVSMDTSVRFAGLIVHLVEVEVENSPEARTASSPGSNSPWFDDGSGNKEVSSTPVAIWTNSRQFQSILIHPRMLSDHFPDEVMSALRRIYNSSSSSFLSPTSSASSLEQPSPFIRRLKKPQV